MTSYNAGLVQNLQFCKMRRERGSKREKGRVIGAGNDRYGEKCRR